MGGPGANKSRRKARLTLQVVPSNELEDLVEPNDWK